MSVSFNNILCVRDILRISGVAAALGIYKQTVAAAFVVKKNAVVYTVRFKHQFLVF